jgi:predicted dehydrogenase
MEARRLIDSGELGEIYHILGEVYGPVVLKESTKTWRTDSANGGGCLYDYATHIVNLLQYIIGPPEKVLTSVLQNIYSKGVDDAVFATMQYASGASGQLRANWSDETYRKLSVQVTIFGKIGKIRANSQELHAYFKKQPKDSSYEAGWNVKYLTDLSPEVGYYLRGEEYSAQIEYFLDCISKKNLKNINSFEEAQMTDATISLIKSASYTS